MLGQLVGGDRVGGPLDLVLGPVVGDLPGVGVELKPGGARVAVAGLANAARVDQPATLGDIEPGAGAYECIVPPNRFIELITGASTENNSDAVVAARSVELIDAMLRSAAAGGIETDVHGEAPADEEEEPA